MNFTNQILVSLLFTINFFAYTYSNTKGLLPCETNEDCDELDNAKCEEGLCKCNNSIGECEETTQNYVNKIGHKCKITNECNVKNSTCSQNNLCVCDENMVPSMDQRKCLKISNGISGICEESSQCIARTPSTICQGNKCVCQQHMRTFNGACYRKIDLGDNCTLDEECSHIKFSECFNSVCECIGNYTSRASRCEPLVKYALEKQCNDSKECKNIFGIGSYCELSLCKCQELYHFNNKTNKCVRDILLNEKCADHSDCHQPGTEPSRLICILGICQCRIDFNEEHGYCISGVQKLFNKGNHSLGLLFAIFTILIMCML